MTMTPADVPAVRELDAILAEAVTLGRRMGLWLDLYDREGSPAVHALAGLLHGSTSHAVRDVMTAAKALAWTNETGGVAVFALVPVDAFPRLYAAKGAA